MLVVSKLWLLLFLVYVCTPRPASFKDCLKGFFCLKPDAAGEEKMCELQENSPDSSDCVDEEELLGFIPAKRFDKDIRSRIQTLADELERPFGDGIYLIDKRSTALHFGPGRFLFWSWNDAEICSVYAPKKLFLKSWSKTYLPYWLFDKKTSPYSRLLNPTVDNYLKALEAKGVPRGDVFISYWPFFQKDLSLPPILTNVFRDGHLMKVSESKFKDLRFDCVVPPNDLPKGAMTEWLKTDTEYVSKLETNAWKFSNYEPTMDIVEVDKESGTMEILGSTGRMLPRSTQN